MAKILGDAVIKVNGGVLKTIEGSGRLQTGGLNGKTRKGGGKIHGPAKVMMESRISFDVLVDGDLDTAALREIDDATVEFADANGGPAWVVNRAWFVELGEIEEGEDSKMSVTLEGEPAQKVGAS